MQTNAALLATRYARRPLLLTPMAAEELAHRVRALDDRAFTRPGRLDAFLRRVGLAKAGADANPVRSRPSAMEDGDYGPPPPPLEERLAYTPLWLGEPEDLGFCWTLKEGVALMCADTPLVETGEEFCGVVYHGYDTLLAGLREAMADSRVLGVFLRLSSPGGVVAGGLPALAAFMRQARATGNAAGKPIHVYADMACSAAYWIAAQADRISAPSVGLVGSIGAVLVHEDWSGALTKAGVVVTSIEFPDGGEKTAGAAWKSLSPGAKADLQAEIDQCGRLFLADVALGRPQLTAEALEATKARVFMAQNDDPERSGLELGFVDAIETEEEAFAALLAVVKPEISAPKPAVPMPAAATGARAGRTATKEPTMAARDPKTPTLAQLQARRAELDAQIVAATAETPQPGAATPPKDEEDKEDQVDGGADEGAEGEAPGEDAAEGEQDNKKKPGSETPEGEAAAEATAKAERDAILASAEAKAHPHLALAAVRDGLTLAQFKGQVAAMAETPRSGALAQAMAGARRLGPDAGKPGAGGESALVASAKRMAAGK